MDMYLKKQIFFILYLWNGKKHGSLVRMTLTKKKAKLTFVPMSNHLKELELNTIPQVTIALSYVLKWAKIKMVVEELPKDHKNVLDFFKAIKKLSTQTFQPKKFNELWNNYNMEDITDYKLEALGVVDEIEDDYS